MTRRRATALVAALLLAPTSGCRRSDAATPEELRAAITTLLKERGELRRRLGDAVSSDRRLLGLPANEVRVGVPTSLVRTLVERFTSGFVDSLTLKLSNLRVHRSGSVRKVFTLGEYDLKVVIDEVTGQLATGKPEVVFGGNRMDLALPVRLASGKGDATIDFVWNGRSVGGAVCGDMQIRQRVSGLVKPASYPVRGSLRLVATPTRILVEPKFPPLRINLRVEPSPESWAAVQKILDERRGLCGFVLDKVDIAGALQGLIGKGFNVRLPTERIRPVAVPVGIAPSLDVRGQPVVVVVKVAGLAITEHMAWLGADVRLDTVAAGSR